MVLVTTLLAVLAAFVVNHRTTLHQINSLKTTTEKLKTNQQLLVLRMKLQDEVRVLRDQYAESHPVVIGKLAQIQQINLKLEE